MTETGVLYYIIVVDEIKEYGVRVEHYIKGLYVEVNGNNVIIKGIYVK